MASWCLPWCLPGCALALALVLVPSSSILLPLAPSGSLWLPLVASSGPCHLQLLRAPSPPSPIWPVACPYTASMPSDPPTASSSISIATPHSARDCCPLLCPRPAERLTRPPHQARLANLPPAHVDCCSTPMATLTLGIQARATFSPFHPMPPPSAHYPSTSSCIYPSRH
ncbi:hypothetical protein COCMIDRAFT_25037 [Bipolaris oryzae ATCC 44560]|uniref:Uncharacterized protein n=1 Tax=Bipolaris oryzae ATCC 44560 TaxID=930090 RepID=W6ZHU3_COCMI|nr:uncharacterized protein COCMIDRAFT_25037 [Bipolaris oryzae ATCC 44560]EUC46979.1 hypothetical protein COCMIDRAFT_25037 [Bipolaris oryzae ATCC 44560]